MQQLDISQKNTHSVRTSKKSTSNNKKNKTNVSKKNTENVDDLIQELSHLNVSEKMKVIIQNEEKIKTEDNKNNINDAEKGILSHLGNYIEEPYNIIESYK